jgi:hypothetical protein
MDTNTADSINRAATRPVRVGRPDTVRICLTPKQVSIPAHPMEFSVRYRLACTFARQLAKTSARANLLRRITSALQSAIR